MGKLNYIHKKIFNSSDNEAVQKMDAVIQEYGGTLHFKVKQYDDGWVARCEEINAIMTGGKGPAPNDEKIGEQIQDAIYSAFNIQEVEKQFIRNAKDSAFDMVHV